MVILFYLFLISQNYDKPWEPVPGFKIGEARKTQIQEFKPLFFLPLLSIRTYQSTLSKVLGESCNFDPSCSNYAFQSIKKYGIQGFFMTFDRLERCNLFAWLYLNKYYGIKDVEDRGLKLTDPPEQNILFGRYK